MTKSLARFSTLGELLDTFEFLIKEENTVLAFFISVLLHTAHVCDFSVGDPFKVPLEYTVRPTLLQYTLLEYTVRPTLLQYTLLEYTVRPTLLQYTLLEYTVRPTLGACQPVWIETQPVNTQVSQSEAGRNG
jgi:hypothetical protein